MTVREGTVARTDERAPGDRCHSCGAAGLEVFYEVERVPVHSCLLLPTREAALEYPTGGLRLAFCSSCGFIQNTLFDPGLLDYSASYEETQGFSPRFQQFARELAQTLVDRHDLRGKRVLEIGCGKGEFLALLCRLGGNTGAGIDPAYVEGRLDDAATSGITFIQDFYSERYSHLSGDLVVCRHTLEHIQPTGDFLRTVRRSIGGRRDVAVFFEAPDVVRVLRELAFWDIYYEHCSYFSLGSLARLFRDCGFDITELATGFDDQYLLLDARPVEGRTVSRFHAEDDLERLARDVRFFRENAARKLDGWRETLDAIRRSGRRPVIWGSGSKAVAFLNAFGIRDEIECVVDINPHKHGMYLAGSGHRIAAPESLIDYRPDVVIVMNPVYCDEIGRQLREMNVSAELLPV
ncbi:MAG: class I SAM-dependent methyltransferase [Dehalococcoidia bacterium]